MIKVVSIENHPNDSRVKIRSDETVQSLTGRMGTGGGNVPLVLIYEDTLQQSKDRSVGAE